MKTYRIVSWFRALTPAEADDAELVRGFDEVEERKIGPGVREAYHRMLDTLEERAKNL